MADSFLSVNAATSGVLIPFDVTTITTGAGVVNREAVSIADAVNGAYRLVIDGAGKIGVTSADGGQVSIGSITDTAWVSGAGTVLAVLKGIFGKLSGTLTATLTGALPAGTNAIGSVSVSSLTATQPALHRSAIAAADGTTKPATNDAKWLANPGNRIRARVFVSTTGSPTTATVRPYLRSGGTSGQVGTGPLQTVAGSPNYDACFDVQTDGDDLLCQIETLAGGTAPAVSISVSWR